MCILFCLFLFFRFSVFVSQSFIYLFILCVCVWGGGGGYKILVDRVNVSWLIIRDNLHEILCIYIQYLLSGNYQVRWYMEIKRRRLSLTPREKSKKQQQENLKSKWQHKNPTKTPITQQLLTVFGRSAGVTTATQLVWFNRFTGS